MHDRSPAPHESPTLRRAAIAIAVLAALALLALWSSGGFDVPFEPERASSMATASAGRAAAVGAAGTEARATLSTLPKADAEPPQPVDLDLRYEFTLQLQVSDASGLPIADAHLFVAPPQCGFALVPIPTDSQGRLDYRSRGRAPEQQLWLAVMAFGSVEPLRVVTLQASQPYVAAFVARGRAQRPSELLQLLAQEGDEGLVRAAERAREDLRQLARQTTRPGRLRRRDEFDTLCGRSLMLFHFIPCAMCHDASKFAAYEALQRAPDVGRTLHPTASYRDLLLAPPTDADRRERGRQVLSPSPEQYEQRLRQEFGRDRLGVVRGVVRSARGAPVENVPVVWLGSDGVVRHRCTTDADGRYRLSLPGNGACTVVAAGGGLGRDEALVAAPAAGACEQDFLLRPRAVVRGHATDETGAPLVGWRVEFAGDAEPGAAIAVTDAEGAFAMSHLPASGHCLLWPQDADLRLPVLASPIVLPDEPDLHLQLPADPPARSRLRLHPRLPPGHERAQVEARLWQVDTGCAAHLERVELDGAFLIEGLPAGPYRGELGAQGLGWVEIGPLYLDGRGLWDLGVVELPLPGRVRFVVANGVASPLDVGAQFYRQRSDTDIAVDAAPVDAATVSLPAGDYALLWRDERRELRARKVRVDAAAETIVTIVD